MFGGHALAAFSSCAAVSKGDIPVEEPLRRPLTFALTGVFGERIGEVRSERSQDGQLKLSLGCRVQPLDMVDNLTSTLQIPFGPVVCHEAVQTGLLFPE